MRPGREIDTQISKEVMGYNVKVKQRELWEDTPLGDRPLRKYSRDITAAWEVAEKLNITLIPVENKSWFAMAGKDQRWSSPADFLKYITTGNFVESGASVDENPALAICLAAIKAIQSRKVATSPDVTAETPAQTEPPQVH